MKEVKTCPYCSSSIKVVEFIEKSDRVPAKNLQMFSVILYASK